jgi:hypothetical protein
VRTEIRRRFTAAGRLALRTALSAAGAALVLSLTVALPAHCAAQPAASSVAEVRQSLAELEQYLGDDAQASAWNSYLRTSILQRELARGDDADEVAVYRVLSRYSSGQSGLELAPFRKVRLALAAWHATLKPIGKQGLPDLARQIASEIHPAAESDVASARRELSQAIEQFASSLTSEADRRWADGLQLPAIRELAGTTTPDVRAASELLRALAVNTVGAERRELRLLRRALQHYVELSVYAADAKSDERTKAALAAVAEDLPAVQKEGADSEAARRLGRNLGYLQRAGQASRLVGAIRRYYVQPNLFIQINRDVLAPAFEGPVDQVAPVQQFILGTDIRGTGHTVGRVDFALVPASDRATFAMTLNAKTYTDTVGYNGPVSIYSTGVAYIRSTKRILFDIEGLSDLPAQSTARVDNTINDIVPNRCGIGSRLIERIAWKKAGQQEGEAREIAANLAADRASEQFNEQGRQRIAEANGRLRDKFRLPLVQKDELPLVRSHTTDSQLFAEVLQANIDQLGALSDPPAIDGAPALAVRVHESAAANFGNVALAGETLNQAKIEKFYKDNNQPVPEELKPKADEPDWSMTFARVDPVTVSLDDNGFRVTLRGQRYTSGDRAFQAMDISAAYKIEKTDRGARLVRQGDLEISPPGHKPGQTLNAGQIALRRLLTRRFDGLFKPEIVTEGLKPPGRLASLGTLTLTQLTCDNGWATLGWKTK